MNDDFLHRIRVEPPADFLARLKSRLDKQPTEPKRTRRTAALRTLALGLFFGGSVFAITLLTVNGVPESIRRLVTNPHPGSPAETAENASPANGHTNHTPAAPSNQPQLGANNVAGERQALSRDRGNGRSDDAVATKDQTPVTKAGTATTVSSNTKAPSGTPPASIRVATLKSLREYVTTASENLRTRPDISSSVKAVSNSGDAIAAVCNAPPTASGLVRASADIAVITRRLTPAENDGCTRYIDGVAELPMGTQAIVIVRSKLYGALQLSPRDIFLALAAEVPDLAHPGAIIPNTNKSWSRVNGALENEPIEVIGPPLGSTTGMAFVDLLVEPGCRAFPEIAALQQTDKARYEQICTTLRRDGVYVETDESAFSLTQRLQLNPNAIAVTGYNVLASAGAALVASPISGTPPNLETIRSGTYLASRPLYAYLGHWWTRYLGSYSLSRFAEGEVRRSDTSEMIPAEATQTKTR